MLRVDREGCAVVFTIDRPDAKNALDLDTFATLTDAIRNTTGPRAAIITGGGDTFVSGGDLKELRERLSEADAAHLSDVGYGLMTAIAEAPYPVIAAINGAAIGGGAELAVACDFRIASPKAKMAFKHARMGVTTSWGTAARLRELVGAGTAARLLLGGEELNAKKAKKLGLVEWVVEDPRAEALVYANEIAQAPASSISAMKQLLRGTGDLRALERQLFIKSWASDEHRAAMDAWFSRKPS